MRTLTVEEIKEALEKHALWLENNSKGERADFSNVDFTRIAYNFSGFNLRGADLWMANLQGADFWRADLQYTDLRWADLQGANLWRANLLGSRLQNANLQGVNIDSSCLPLWCGGLDWKIDRKIAVQLAYHFCSMKCNDKDFIALRNSMLDFANEFHHIGYGCNKLEPKIDLPTSE
jgi:hypothetical protein